MGSKRKSKHNKHINSINSNKEAIEAHINNQTKKTFTLHDLDVITPLTDAQKDVFEHFMYGNSIFLKGSAGTGKTFLSMYLALREVFDKSTLYKKVIVVRSAQPVKEIGHLPGSIEEKTEIYEMPFASICDDLFTFKKSYENMKKAGIIEFIPTSFIRGITLHDSIVIVDECQDLEWQEIYAILTRAGNNTKYYICGDTKQCDLKYQDQRQGYKNLDIVIDSMKDFGKVNFTTDDIVRSSFVKDFIIASEKLI